MSDAIAAIVVFDAKPQQPAYRDIPITRPFLKKRAAKEGDWCGCCSQLMPPGTPMVGVITHEGNRWIAVTHLQTWLNSAEDNTLSFHRHTKK